MIAGTNGVVGGGSALPDGLVALHAARPGGRPGAFGRRGGAAGGGARGAFSRHGSSPGHEARLHASDGAPQRAHGGGAGRFRDARDAAGAVRVGRRPRQRRAATCGSGNRATGRAHCANARGSQPNARRTQAGHGETRANRRAGAELITASARILTPLETTLPSTFSARKAVRPKRPNGTRTKPASVVSLNSIRLTK